eukprot:scaffold6598_cov54-Cyclotella_meneghiniana.AAC.3
MVPENSANSRVGIRVSTSWYRRGRVDSRVYPITLRSSRVGSAPTKYPYPKAFYPGIGCRVNFG